MNRKKPKKGVNATLSKRGKLEAKYERTKPSICLRKPGGSQKENRTPVKKRRKILEGGTGKPQRILYVLMGGQTIKENAERRTRSILAQKEIENGGPLAGFSSLVATQRMGRGPMRRPWG